MSRNGELQIAGGHKISMYVCIFVCMYVCCMYVCMRVCMQCVLSSHSHAPSLLTYFIILSSLLTYVLLYSSTLHSLLHYLHSHQPLTSLTPHSSLYLTSHLSLLSPHSSFITLCLTSLSFIAQISMPLTVPLKSSLLIFVPFTAK